MKDESEMMLERVGRSCRVPREELCSKVPGQEVSVAHEENAGCTLLWDNMSLSITSSRGLRKNTCGGSDVNLCFVSYGATLSRYGQKQL
jgi:hypothetical protein